MILWILDGSAVNGLVRLFNLFIYLVFAGIWVLKVTVNSAVHFETNFIDSLEPNLVLLFGSFNISFCTCRMFFSMVLDSIEKI